MNRNKVITALIYKFLERLGTQGIAFMVSLILARLLSPSDYGLISLMTIFITITAVFVQSGLGTALVQKKEVDEKDYSSVFFLSLLIASLMYLLLFFVAPLISEFYRMSQVTQLFRVNALILLPNAFNSIQNAKLVKEMKFKKIMFCNLGAVIISGTVGIFMAFRNYGAWALVGQQIAHSLSICVIMLIVVKWKPKLFFSFTKVKALYSFGWKLLVSSLIDTLYRDLQSLIIGRKFNAATLGLYNRGKHFPQLIMSNIDSSINSVMLPVYSQEQDNGVRLKAMVRRSILSSSFLVFPAMAGLAAVAKPLVLLLLTEKWLPAVPFLQLSCILYAFWPIHTANLQAIKAMGRSDIFLKVIVIQKLIGIVILIVSVVCFKDVMAILLGSVLAIPLELLINAWPNSKLLDYHISEQMKDIFPSFFIAILMGLLVWLVSLFDFGLVLTMIIQISLGIFSYLFAATIFKIEAFNYIKKTISEIIHAKEPLINDLSKYPD